VRHRLIALAWRAQVGARLPMSEDALYMPSMPVARLLHNLRNYAGRMAPAPLAIVLAVALGAVAAGGFRRFMVAIPQVLVAGRGLVLLAIAWAVAFLAPALPFVARSELYVYLPGFGLCVLAGSCAAAALEQRRPGALTIAAVGLSAAALALYQGGRAREMYRDAMFSRRFVTAIGQSADVAASAGPVEIVPADADTARFLQDAVGGYFPVVLRLAYPGRMVDGRIAGDRAFAEPPALRLSCAYRNDRVELTR
jgi:hypothetical protein